MYDYIRYFQRTDAVKDDNRLYIAEVFFERYNIENPVDIYRWLWEGEFGPGSKLPELTLDVLTDDIRKSRIQMGSRKQPVWEPLGLNDKLLKINLVPYADSNCPLNTLIQFSERIKDIKANTLRFKKNWYFMKTQIVPGHALTVERMNDFENSIAFHMTPEMQYSEQFLEQYGNHYRVVPASLFFSHFPEFNPEDQRDGDFV